MPPRPTLLHIPIHEPNGNASIGVVGAGFVGLTTAALFTRLGHPVTCLDTDPRRLAELEQGRVPFHEPGLAEELLRHRHQLTITSDPDLLYRRSSIVFVCVDTPPRPDGTADLSRIDAVTASIPAWASPLLVMKSTVPVGTAQRIRARLDESGRSDIDYVSNPEFLREGSALHDVTHPDRIVIGGLSTRAVDSAAALYQRVAAPVIRTDPATAEMIKYAANTFLATKISFINEIANICELVDADIDTVAASIGADPRIAPGFLKAGIGYGGSCFGKDLSALAAVAAANGYQSHLLSAVQELNRRQRLTVITKLKSHLAALDGATIALLGLAFKPDTDDMRDAPSVQIANALTLEGAAIRAWDPVVSPQASGGLPPSITHAPTPIDAVRGADAAIIATEWPQLTTLLDPSVPATMRTPILIDGRNLLDPARARRAGFIYHGVGRPTNQPHTTQTRKREAA